MSEKLKRNRVQYLGVVTPVDDPPAGQFFEYYKEDGNLYRKDSTGKEFRVEGNGSKIFLSQTQV